ncbi:hypothetical protein P3T76_009184 [Phytophthora citrophthora]|uniref:Uncharacterized protein n=1 Tax=Phytophthora citrophthora TaxID=4793 RepID=A0AAD9LJW5_9STRA|nr:hypothetical protein P3T76_009184 [Phytophthora citrophthora]
MELVNNFLLYAKLVVVLVGRMVVQLLRVGAASLSEVAGYLLGTPRVDLRNGDKQLLETESVHDAVLKDLAAEWVDVSDEDNWEPGGRYLLDENEKRSRQASVSTTEDELIEFSDGEERTTLTSSLYKQKDERIVLSLNQTAPF